MVELWNIKGNWKARKKKLSFMEAAEYNNLAEKFYRLFTSVFEWKGLPDEIDPANIERYLFEDGMALIWRSPDFGPIVTRTSTTGWDINGNPKEFLPRYDFRPPEIKEPERMKEKDKEGNMLCVPIQDCSKYRLRRSDVLYKIFDIVDVNETIRQQVWNQKTPLMAVSGTDKQRQKAKFDVMEIQENQKVLFTDSDIGDTLKVLDFKAPFNIEGLNAWRNVLINEILEQGGIDSQDAFMKKERKLVDEVEGNDEILNYYLADCLKARQRAAKKLSEFFGTEITVEVQKVIRPMMEADGSIGGNDDDNKTSAAE